MNINATIFNDQKTHQPMLPEVGAAEEALRASEERLRVALDSAHFGTFDLNPLTGDLGWDAQMKRIWRIQPNEEINLEEALRRIHPEDQKRVNDTVNVVMAPDANGEYEAEYRLVWPDGTVHWSSAKGRVYFQGEGEQRHAVRFIGVQRDITEAKRIEEALRESEQRFRALAENVPQLVWVADAGANFRYLSPKWLEYTGTSEEENANGRWFNALHPEDRATSYERWETAVTTRNNYDTEYRVRRADGQFRWHLVRAVHMTDANTGESLWFGTATDIEDQKRSQQALIQSEKLASVGRMAASIAHEINNPLDAVMNAVFIARTNADSPDQVREALNLADEELRRIAHLTRQTLAFYRESTTPAPVVLNSVLDSAIDLFKAKIRAKRANIRNQYETRVEVVAVAGELRQVVSNLLSNSLDAIQDRGTITVTLKSMDQCEADNRVEVSVVDNGKGIPADKLSRIFEPFFTTKESLGTGLGLWITKQLIEKHGGSVSLHSATEGEHRGTTVSVLLPANCAVAKRQTPPA